MTRKTFLTMLARAFFVAPLLLEMPVALAQSTGPAASSAVGIAVDATALSEGEVRKIDKDARKLTLRHDPLANLDMPVMTMVFRVSDPSMLDRVQIGGNASASRRRTDSWW